ncbi:MAG: DUF3052 domain-containing protein [Myxococcaceae bacterium]|nr:DUF3052 domain-containing protein [Myxococcaceae bacterium]
MSTLTLPELLGIRTGMRISVLNPPEGFLQKLEPLPDGAALIDSSKTGLDLTLYFSTKKTDLVEKLPGLARGMAVTGYIWVIFPAVTESSLVPTEDFVRMLALEVGLADDKKLVPELGWSGLRLAWKPRAPRLDKPQIQA